MLLKVTYFYTLNLMRLYGGSHSNIIYNGVEPLSRELLFLTFFVEN